jgi:hypothetical protein
MGANTLHQIEGILRIAVHVYEYDVDVIPYRARDIVEVGRVGTELSDGAVLTFTQSASCGVAAIHVRTNDRD